MERVGCEAGPLDGAEIEIVEGAPEVTVLMADGTWHRYARRSSPGDTVRAGGVVPAGGAVRADDTVAAGGTVPGGHAVLVWAGRVRR